MGGSYRRVMSEPRGENKNTLGPLLNSGGGRTPAPPASDPDEGSKKEHTFSSPRGLPSRRHPPYRKPSGLGMAGRCSLSCIPNSRCTANCPCTRSCPNPPPRPERLSCRRCRTSRRSAPTGTDLPREGRSGTATAERTRCWQCTRPRQALVPPAPPAGLRRRTRHCCTLPSRLGTNRPRMT